MENGSREPNGPLGQKPPAGDEQQQNTRNELGHNNEGYAGVGFVSQGFAPQLARTDRPEQAQRSETAQRDETLERWQAGGDLSE